MYTDTDTTVHHKGLRLLLILCFYKGLVTYVNDVYVKEQKVLTTDSVIFWDCEYLFFNYWFTYLSYPFINIKYGWYTSGPPGVIISSYYRLDKYNAWKYTSYHDLQIFHRRKIDNNLVISTEINYKVEDWYPEHFLEKDLISNNFYTKDIYIWMEIPFIVSTYFTNPIEFRTVCKIDVHKMHLFLHDTINLDSYYFDDPYKWTDYIEGYDSGSFVGFVKFGMQIPVIPWQFYQLYILNVVENVFGQCFFYGLYVNVFILFYYFLWGFLAVYIYHERLIVDEKRHMKFIYKGKYFRELHYSTIGRIDLEHWHHNRRYTTHITGKNGLERFLWTYWSCYLWARDKRLQAQKLVRDDSSKLATQLHVDNILNGFWYQDEVRMYFDKYTFASYYFNFGKGIELLAYRRDKFFHPNIPTKMFNYKYQRPIVQDAFNAPRFTFDRLHEVPRDDGSDNKFY